MWKYTLCILCLILGSHDIGYFIKRLISYGENKLYNSTLRHHAVNPLKEV